MKRTGELLARRMKAMGLRPLNRSGLRRLAVVVLAISPPFLCALLAEGTGRWDLFERSGSTTAAVGLLLASRRYIGHGVLELTMLHLNDPLKSDIAEVQEHIVTSKFGLALSAFGTVIWGWGAYIGWWGFGCLAIWVLFAIRDTRRDQSLSANESLREFAAWYRSFAEQAENPMIREARLRTAEDLEIEAKRMGRRNRQIDPGHRTKPDAE
jgi:hypothetical protein